MKTILIIISSFRWGGINVSLQSLLKNIDPKEVNVDIFVMVHSGSYENQFSNCNILPKNFFVDSMVDHVVLKHGFTKLISAAMKIVNRLTKEKFQHWLFKVVGNNLIKAKKYDAVIGWHEGVPTTFVSHIDHPNKISWIHCDYANYDSTSRERWLYEKIGTIVCVSEYTRGTFLSFFPEMANKVKTIYNTLDVDGIKHKAEAGSSVDMATNKFTIVSVGRVSPVKQFKLIPGIARKIIDEGCDFCWYIVGPTYPGEEYDTLTANIEKYGVKDHIILLGGKENPYPYIAKSDLLVSTSLSESWGYTINEAKVLGVPSVSTDWGAAKESIDDTVNGNICDLEHLHEPIVKLIKTQKLMNSYKENLKGFKYDNKVIVETIETLL